MNLWQNVINAEVIEGDQADDFTSSELQMIISEIIA
jgi:hypothetical protein